MKIKKLFKLKRHIRILILMSFLMTFELSFSFPKGSNDINLLPQQIITGTVKDVNGEPLPGVNILEQGTTNGTQTDFDGNFSIEVEKGSILVLSYVGFISQEIQVTSQKVLKIILEEDTSELDTVVVIGYGNRAEKKIITSLETVLFGDNINQPVTNSGQLLYGRASGIQLTQASGNPGSDGSSIVIRGVGTFGDSNPLIVIDNIQYDDLVAFNNLNPLDIESITVLKDASASAIYGARGANGVILVTTKKGNKNNFEMGYNSYYGVQDAIIKPNFLGAFDYATLINEKFRNRDGEGFDPRYTDDQMQLIANGNSPDLFADTNWTDAVLKTADIVSHNLYFSGGNAKSSYRVSLGYLGQDAIVRSKFRSDRYNLSFNINSNLKDWLTLNSVTNSFWRRNEGPSGGDGTASSRVGIIRGLQRTAPTIPLYYSNGEFGHVDGAFENSNPSFMTPNLLKLGFLGNREEDRINFNQRIGLSFKLFNGFSFETSGSANIIYSNISDFSPTEQRTNASGDLILTNDLNQLTNTTGLEYRLLNENILRYYTTLVSDHSVEFLLGHSVSYFKNDGFTGRLSGFPTDDLEEFNAGGTVDPTVSGGAIEEAYQSFFGRINYDYKEKYLAQFNLTRKIHYYS